MCNSVDRIIHYREGDDDEQNHLQTQTFNKWGVQNSVHIFRLALFIKVPNKDKKINKNVPRVI